MEKREKLGSRLGFILLSAGCAIGCGNVWKFPWMTGQNGGGGFVLIYVLCLILLGLPIMVMEFSIGRAAQKSPIKMYQQLEKPKAKWHLHGYLSLLANFALMAFYTVVTGWMITYFVKFLTGANETMAAAGGSPFVSMITNTPESMLYTGIVLVVAFFLLCFKLQGGLERVTKYMMVALFVLMVGLAVYCGTLPGAAEGYKFYLLPDFSKINGGTIVAAMNQAFFTLSLGIGSMAIFGSYLDKDRSLLGESINIISLDTAAALLSGLIIFPACASTGQEVGAGPALLFETMLSVFNKMGGTGRIIGTLFFLFMVFAAMSTVFAVCENIVAMVRDLFGWKRPLACLVCGIVLAGLALTTILGYGAWSGFHPFGDPNLNVLDMWDFIVSQNLLPLGSLCYVLFCCNKYGWGWDNFLAEANAGKGLKVKAWVKPWVRYAIPVIIVFLYVYGLLDFFHVLG